jgi:hypothetical protein
MHIFAPANNRFVTHWLSNGRVDLGVGIGWPAQGFATLRVPFERRGGLTQPSAGGRGCAVAALGPALSELGLTRSPAEACQISAERLTGALFEPYTGEVWSS